MLSYFLAALLAADTPAASVPPAAAPARTSPQAVFNAAEAAFSAGRFDEALATFTELEALPSVRRSPLVHGTILMRKGAVLVSLRRFDEAEDTLRAGLKVAPADRTETRNDRYLSEQALGRIELSRLNYAAATERFRRALALADDPTDKGRALIDLSRSTMFEPGGQALGYVDQALAGLGPQPAKTRDDKKRLADIQTIRARALLNQGRHAEAFAVLKQAVTDQGGLDLKVDYREIVTRSDLAIAALLAGKPDEARRYLAYTGAGRIADSPFQLAVNMEPPACGGAMNLQPDDVAVVEFSIKPDGTVGNATPIYASVNGPAAIEFARAVTDWSWRPEAVAKIPELFRYITRVELRCSTSSARPPLGQLLTADLNTWLSASGAAPPPPSTSPAADLAPLKAELARREASGGEVSLIPILIRLGDNPIESVEDRLAWLIRARDIAVRGNAPIGATMAIEIRIAPTLWQKNRFVSSIYRSYLRDLLSRPGVAGDTRVSNTLKLMIAEPINRARAPSDAATLLGEVANDTRLSKADPLRVGALIRLAALQAQKGDKATAAMTYQQTGLTEQQCALLDAKPALLKDNIGSNDFPTEALGWGFEGWVRTEYDIMADGSTAAQRAIVAYPPFVFRDAAIRIMKKASYSKSYRPDGGAACSGEQENINFITRR